MTTRTSGLIFVFLYLSVFAGSLVAQTGRPNLVVDNTEAEKWRQDLRYMAEEMPKYHKNLFHAVTRDQFAVAVARLNEKIPSLARHQIIVELARIVAMVSDGHTNIAPTRDPKIGFRTFPVKLYFFADGLYVRAATREHADIVGTRVRRIGNVSTNRRIDPSDTSSDEITRWMRSFLRPSCWLCRKFCMRLALSTIWRRVPSRSDQRQSRISHKEFREGPGVRAKYEFCRRSSQEAPARMRKTKASVVS